MKFEAARAGRRRRQGHQRRAVSVLPRRKKNASSTRAPGRRSGNRVVKRDSPWPRSHRAAPSFPVHAALVFGRARRREERDILANEHGAERPREEGGPRVVSKGIARARSPRQEATKYECSSRNGFGVQTSIGRIAGRDARGRYQAHLGHARPSTKEALLHAVDARGGAERVRQRCAGLEASSQRETLRGSNRTR